jgi:hypothetical protein
MKHFGRKNCLLALGAGEACPDYGGIIGAIFFDVMAL